MIFKLKRIKNIYLLQIYYYVYIKNTLKNEVRILYNKCKPIEKSVDTRLMIYDYFLYYGYIYLYI